jgi:aspartate/methionine/tyrosine aminotransferase
VLAHPNCIVISDEVYQHLVYDGHKHVSIATLPGMWDRTMTVCRFVYVCVSGVFIIGSAGKTFSVTGWKIGWVVAHRELVACLRTVCSRHTIQIRNVVIVNQWVQYSVPTPLQACVLVKQSVDDDDDQ